MNKLSFEELDPKTTCCFTGHRPEKLRSGEAEIRTLLREAILDSIEEGYDTFISGMAPGVDLWAAQEVLAVKLSGRDIRLICAVPFPGAEKNRDPAHQSLFRKILEASDAVRYVCQKYKPWCFTARDKWMVEHASMVIAVFNGTRGGTESTIKYAIEQGRQLVLIDDTLRKTEANEHREAYIKEIDAIIEKYWDVLARMADE